MDLEIGDPVLQVGVVVLAALLVHVTLGRIRLPVLVGLLVLGMVMGPGGAGMIAQEPIIEPLGHIGLLFVMFTAGLEIDLELVERHRRQTVTFGVLSFACTALPAFALALLLGFGTAAAVLIGALVSSHTLLAYPVLQRLGLVRRLSVTTAIGGTLLTDTLALVVLAVTIGPDGVQDVPFGWAIPVLGLAALAVAAMWAVPRLADVVFARPSSTRAERSLFTMVVLLGLAAAAELVGTEGILGAFLAGIALNRALAQRETLREHVEYLGSVFFVPFFFFWTGTLLEVEVFLHLPGVWGLAGALLLLVLVGKSSAAWITGAAFGYRPRERVLMIGLTIPQAAATLAVAITAQRAGVFDVEVVDAVVIVILVTCLVGTVLTQRSGQRLADEEPRTGAVAPGPPLGGAGGDEPERPR